MFLPTVPDQVRMSHSQKQEYEKMVTKQELSDHSN